MTSAYGVFSPLPAGSVSPRGWLRDWASINAEGWLLDYARQQDPRVYGRLWNRVKTAEIRMSENGEWLDPPDYNAYFADALVRYAHLFPGSEIARRADEWIEKALASQDEDGYIGAYVPEARWKNWLEIFAQSVVLEALLFRYETTGDARIIEAVERCARRQIEAWSAPSTEKRIFSTHGTITVRLMTALHRCTGNERYLDFAREVLEAFGKTRTYLAAAQKAWYTPAGDALVGEHDRLGTLGDRPLELRGVDVVGAQAHIHEHRHRAELHDRRDRCGKASSDSDDLVASANRTLAQLFAGQRCKRQQVRARPGVHEKRTRHAEIRRKPVLELLGPTAIRQPEVQRRIDKVDDFALIEDSPAVGYPRLAGNELGLLGELGLVVLGDFGQDLVAKCSSTIV